MIRALSAPPIMAYSVQFFLLFAQAEAGSISKTRNNELNKQFLNIKHRQSAVTIVFPLFNSILALPDKNL